MWVALRRASRRPRAMVVIAAAVLGVYVAQAQGVTLPPGCAQVGATVTCTYTSGQATFTVPAGVTTVHVVAVGGMGAAGSGGAPGGHGAVVNGDLTVTPGSTLTAFVAGNGSSPGGGANGGGGGTNYQSNVRSGGGGGASDVRTVAGNVASRVLVAAGGGGGGNPGDIVTGDPGVAGGSGGTAGATGGNGADFAALPSGTAQGGGGGTGASGTTEGPGGTGGMSALPYTFTGCTGADGGTGGTVATGGNGGTTNGVCASGGGGGGGGLAGGGGGGAGGAGNSTANQVEGGSGGGGGGSNLVPAGGSATIDTTGVPSVAISYTVPGGTPAPPSAAISVPANGATLTAGQVLSTQFSCTEGSGGPGITSCVDQSGRPSGSALDTATPGAHTLTVTATSGDAETGTATSSYTVTPAAGVPISSGPPKITGTPKAGAPLACSNGTWSNNPTSYAYEWSRDGTPVQGANGPSYTVQTPDEQLTLTCTVTASNAAGAGPAATSNGVTVPVPKVPHCPAATGQLSGQTLGLVHLGMTRKRARHAYTHSSDRGKKFEDFFCLTPIGVRVGYASSALIKTLHHGLGSTLRQRVIWASTSSGYYSVHGIRPGATVAAAGQHLKLAGPFHVGLNFWYLAPNGSSTAVFKVRAGIIEEIGIGDKRLTAGHQAEINFLKSFS